jgi:pilus assembly protein FimV
MSDDTDNVVLLDTEPHVATQETEQLSTIDLDIETSDSLGMMTTDDMATDSISLDMGFDDTEIVEEKTEQISLDYTNNETSEDFQLVTDAVDNQSLSTTDNQSTIFALDDVSSELVESAQISEMLSEVSQTHSEFAEESVISELFEPASLMQESELFESELSDLDEVADKLDLARAYVDMEDSESARGILKEVIETGTDEQKQIAKSMVQALEKSA